MALLDFIELLKSGIPFAKSLLIIIIAYMIFGFVLSHVAKVMLKHAATKKQKSNVEIVSRIMKYLFLLLLILFAIFSYNGSLTSIGLSLGLLSAAIGWALQKPITGLAAWIMVVTKRPFEIGDRVIIGGVKGDVMDITLTHLYLREVGGIIPTEETSGRVILVPNASLFEQHIINYTLENDHIRDEVVASVTYECDLDKAMQICLEAAKKHTKEFHVPEKPRVETYFEPSGIGIHVRYFAPTRQLPIIKSAITKEIYDEVKKTKDVEFAYPHTEVILKK
ncbi:mechanosensitive ion channel family protein [Candidatus Woesearchaeota archaeon]|nr:mechanosensitive ion channel family protein [Candidatus Woesearchaeota archaeon]